MEALNGLSLKDTALDYVGAWGREKTLPLLPLIAVVMQAGTPFSCSVIEQVVDGR